MCASPSGRDGREGGGISGIPTGIAVERSSPKPETREKVSGRADDIDALSRPGVLHAAIPGRPRPCADPLL